MGRGKFFWWKVGLTISSFFGTVLMKSNINWNDLSSNYVDNSLVKEILYDLFVGVFSAMILVWFIDEISQRIQDNKNRNKEMEEIKRANRILQLYIENYRLFFYCVITPINRRDTANIKIPEDFTLRDMRDLHKSTLLVCEGIAASSVESFLHAEDELKKEISSLIVKVDFDYFPEVRESLLEFVEISLRYNQKDAILEAKKIKTCGTTLDVEIARLLENEADKFYSEMKSGKMLCGNLMHPYIYLYEMMKRQYNVIEKYQAQLIEME